MLLIKPSLPSSPSFVASESGFDDSTFNSTSFTQISTVGAALFICLFLGSHLLVSFAILSTLGSKLLDGWPQILYVDHGGEVR
jgi:hypothetical protein